MVEAEQVSGPAEERTHAAARWLSYPGSRLLYIALALAGVGLVLFVTRLGAYLSDDSYYYIYPARDLLAGQGFHPSYIFAPLYPLALAAASLPGIDPVVAARWLNALLFGINIFLSGRLIRRMGLHEGFALLGAGLVLLADVVIEAHGWVMSEALSFTFMLLCLNQALDYLDGGKRRHLWAAAVWAALTVLTRYAALPLIAAVGVTFLAYAPQPRFVTRLREAVVFGAASLAPIALYWLRNQLTSGHPVRYENYLKVPFTRDQLIWFLYNWMSLFVPGRLLRGREILAGLAVAVAVVALLAVIGWAYRKQWKQRPDRAFQAGAFLLGAVLVFNLAMLYLARGLTELDVFNPRYLVPMLIVFLVLMVALAGRLWTVAGPKIRLVTALFLAVFLAYYAYRTVDFSRQMGRMGLGYANATWHQSETVPYIRQHPEMTEMVSTGEMGIYFWTGRKPHSLAEFPSNQALNDYLCQKDAALFLMDQMPADIYGITREEAIRGLKLVNQFNDSEMYRCSR